MARGSNALHFISNFGLSYMKSEQEKGDRERRRKQDQLVDERADRERQDYQDKQALKNRLAAASEPTYGDKVQLDAEGLRGTMPGAFDDTQAAQHYLDNVTPEQAQQHQQAYQKAGTFDYGGQKMTAGDKGGLALADPGSAQTKPLWQTLQDRSRVYLETGDPAYEREATQALEQSQRLRSQDYMQRIMEARKGGLDGLLKLLHDHPNEELDIQNPRIIQGEDGTTAQLVGELANGKPIKPISFDLRNGSIEDQITQRLAAMSTPETMLSHITNQIALAKQARKEDADAEKLATSERIAGMREDRRDERQQASLQAMGDRQQRQLSAMEKRQAAAQRKDDGGITPAQFANNQEILLARKRLAGMSVTDVRAKAQQYLPNGRENPEFDPMIAGVWRTANQRMVGNDPQFDDFTKKAGSLKEPKTPRERFEADQNMRGMTLGKRTAKGWEVRDAKGKLIGHYE